MCLKKRYVVSYDSQGFQGEEQAADPGEAVMQRRKNSEKYGTINFSY